MTQKALLQASGDGTTVPAGYIGETQSQSRVRSSGLSLTNSTAANITASPLTLQPGVWLIWGSVGFKFDTSTTYTRLGYAISTTSATFSSGDTFGVPDATGQIYEEFGVPASSPGAKDMTVIVPHHVITLAAATTYYLVGRCDFSAGTAVGYGIISATRIA